jgi:hypothetical protein
MGSSKIVLPSEVSNLVEEKKINKKKKKKLMHFLLENSHV